MKHLTILHNNDMHGDFLPEDRDGVQTGGLALLSGYINKTREEEPNTIYTISGDMFRGSIIDSEFMGLSTIELINLLKPDVATVGNHEVDYGLAHLLFLEKCASFPIINADLFITVNNKRIFNPFRILRVDGINIMLIGLLTEDVLASAKTEKVIGSFVDLSEAARTIPIICDNYKTTKIDLTIILSHLGIEKEKELAARLMPELGVDFIIGGHSHTFMDKPEIVNGIGVVQAGTGTDQIGRIDIDFDEEKHEIVSWKWETVPVNEKTAAPDPVMEDMIDRYKNTTDLKYKRVVTHFKRRLSHPLREQETEMGNLYADIMQEDSSFDIMMFGSGSIRKTEMGPLVEYQDMVENTPFDDVCWMVTFTGAQFRQMIQHVFRDEAWSGHTEFYQFSKGVHIVYNRTTRVIEKLEFRGQEIKDDQKLKVCIQNYHYKNFDEFLGVPLEEIKKNGKPRVVAVSVNNIIEEYLSTHADLDAHIEGRITLVD